MTSEGTTGGTQLQPPVEAVQSHYDRSNEFFKLWLDPSMTYSCAYFDENPDIDAPQTKTLEEAQFAKRKLALDKLNLEPGMTLLDIGSGWGSTMRHAVEHYDVNVIGLTLSENQLAHCRQKFDEMDSPRRKEVRLQGWELFDEPVDRIVSLGAFEHFADGAGDAGYERYATFFKKYYSLLPDDGRMLLHSIVVPTAEEGRAMGLKTTMTLLRFISFILREIYPGGKLPQVEQVDRYSTEAGFKIERHHFIGKNYVPTLNTWADALEANKEKAIELKGEQEYETFIKYLRGCSDLFRDGYTNVCQFTLVK
ncbi:cyclopropane mycolic acid synthase family methyltransferase [Mycobacterium paragordonae]|jgi:cyclopropane-fatty-acyl-phospholipid synthase|uniref:Cyclopropane mycolic acid synthase family methyltransferase n=1 Tax=Mycobacterium paragordonae TaxID=1389713 RepID=A0A4R5WTK4_9MYCO|nr:MULTISPECIES: cyclopropane mycolic acid synthase family methyltransferase [Mycobacterium]MDP7737111.1 cyclopropane mycolic acid synthase family methyltransferase [Mycobacterium paragordonae]OBJ83926.1 SAM-dependent methyltransferase [Mycobacterium gordonae]OBK44077.1 SAM-dependent methyltransferase [Mycobacterium gordonae]TDK94191.1 methyltransferase domain-containing protein [Mycobacterium paragordonae]TDL00317.1 methyltransferase domain-containing protein [Mycobacterium paragordonae]